MSAPFLVSILSKPRKTHMGILFLFSMIKIYVFCVDLCEFSSRAMLTNVIYSINQQIPACLQIFLELAWRRLRLYHHQVHH